MDSAFYNEDTIRLIKFSNRDHDVKSFEFRESPHAYFNHANYIQIAFWKKNSIMGFWEWIEEKIGTRVKYFEGGIWKWNSDEQLLELYINGKLISTLRPIQEKKVEVKERNSTMEMLTTKELTLLKRK